MKNILYLSTGGTIASTRGPGGVAPTKDAAAMLDSIPSLKKLCRVEARSIMNVDSTNMEPGDWKAIARGAFEGLSGFDGVVISHGTHTLAYTAAALSFMIRGVNRPVVITGSQLPFDAVGTDAARNLVDAFVTACEPVAGVFVVFDGRIMRGCRVSKMRTKHVDAFRSVNAPCLGEVWGGKVRYVVDFPMPDKGPPALFPDVAPEVSLFRLFPGFDPGIFDLLPGIGTRGVVIEGYGTGAVPFANEEFLGKVKGLIDGGISTVISTQSLYDGTEMGLYRIGRKCLAAGAIEGHDMTTEALVTKLMWALGQTRDMDGVRRIMGTNYAGEVTLPGPRT
jgi:L-asparaginase